MTDSPEPRYRGALIAGNLCISCLLEMPSLTLYFFFIVGMFITAFSQTMFLHQYFQLCFTTGMKMRAALVTSIYRKTLVLSNSSRQQSTVGEVSVLFVSCSNAFILTDTVDCKSYECGCPKINGFMYLLAYWLEWAVSNIDRTLPSMENNGAQHMGWRQCSYSGYSIEHAYCEDYEEISKNANV